MPVLPIVPDNHYSLLSVVFSDGTVLRFETKDKAMTDKQFLNKYWSLVCNPNFNLDHLLQMQSESWEIFYMRHKNFDAFVKAKFAHKSNLDKAASLEELG